MITVSLWRKTLVEKGACAQGLAYFDKIAALQPESDPRRLKRIKIQWCQLADAWLAVSAGSFGEWLRDNHLIPLANLRSADLRSADLRSANLRSADLRSADLRSANLRSADLRSADLRSADLRSADLRSADLRSADLRSANLGGCSRNNYDVEIPGWKLENGVLVRK